uniref:Uncharacterized protein n=1 Tax=Trichobilharzia regenti TaxID=157069 RepID=A0AA85KJP1_TRIRE|nr:unnamed protein product [Trichobilharzia regenti]
MVPQRTKFNLIALVSLCVINIMEIESDKFNYPMTVGTDGQMTVDFGGILITLSDTFIITIQGKNCTYVFDFSQPNQEEFRVRRGNRRASLACKDDSNTSNKRRRIKRILDDSNR